MLAPFSETGSGFSAAAGNDQPLAGINVAVLVDKLSVGATKAAVLAAIVIMHLGDVPERVSALYDVPSAGFDADASSLPANGPFDLPPGIQLCVLQVATGCVAMNSVAAVPVACNPILCIIMSCKPLAGANGPLDCDAPIGSTCGGRDCGSLAGCGCCGRFGCR